MKCPICKEETWGCLDIVRYGPEFAHGKCAARESQPVALVQFLEGLLAQLGREPNEKELRAAAHMLTVRADRLAVARPQYRGA